MQNDTNVFGMGMFLWDRRSVVNILFPVMILEISHYREALGITGIYGIDILESKDGYFVNEVNGNTEFKNTVPATGVNIPDYIADYLISEAKK